jgi:predicted restriction endonuclease
VLTVKRGEYQLYTLEQPYPSFKQGHRLSDTDSWEEIKQKYNYRCATCGSQEGKPHFHWTATKTVLQKSHKDPNKPLTAGNIIPQCQKCNRADRNRWVYDDYGRVIKLADASFVRNFDLEVRKKTYTILYVEFGGKNPNA